MASKGTSRRVTGATTSLAGMGKPRERPIKVMGKPGQRRRGTASAARGAC